MIANMPAVNIRDIPPEVLQALKARAAKNGRSLQMELRMQLIRLAQESQPSAVFEPLVLALSEAGPEGNAWPRAEIYDDLRG